MSSTPIIAYLDPGTGSMVLQAVVGGILGGLLAIKLAWRRIVRLFKRDDPATLGKAPANPGASSTTQTPK